MRHVVIGSRKPWLALALALTAMSPAQTLAVGEPSPDESAGRLRVRVSWGHESAPKTPFRISLRMTEGAVEDLEARGLEEGEGLRDGAFQTLAGGGDADGVEFTLRYPERPVTGRSGLHATWSYLLEHTDADAARRLRLDPGFRPDGRKLTVLMDEQETRGFSVTVDQLRSGRAFRIPELDVFLSAGDPPATYDEHQRELAPWRGRRILDQVGREPEASYEEFVGRWEDMGSLSYHNPAEQPPGHVVCVAWDGALHKFGIDRRAGVHSDLGNPDRFKLRLGLLEAAPPREAQWKRQQQRLTDGLPVIVTRLESDATRCEVEQFAYPLDGPPPERDGTLPMVLLQKVTLRELQGKARRVTVVLSLEPGLAADRALAPWRVGGAWLWEAVGSGDVRLAIEGIDLAPRAKLDPGAKTPTWVMELDVDLPAGGSREFTVKLPSPVVPPSASGRLLAIDHAAAREATLRHWSAELDRGARFVVPEAPVNELFRANLWHAMRLPRRHSRGPDAAIDLPYSNFAYGQEGTPWPVNQAVYVDFMLYDLRGHHDLAHEELRAIYRKNQEPDGHVGGFANWGVYTPGMLYAVAQHALLSQDRAALNDLLPQTLKALDWCLAQTRQAEGAEGPVRGLMLAPLNDLTKEPRAWAFNQAYLFAGLDLFGRVLEEHGHPRAAECRSAARAFREAVERAFARAATEAPLIQLRDHTWIPYVPCVALTPRRLMDVWYPTDVDTGALHLTRLGALAPAGALSTYLLHDHEDNLFFRGWGMANEPVYNQQAAAYLLRDEVKPVIRAFYSMMACAFSHSAFEPVEHRWGWGQYFGPPSTDGAWFDLYRRMLIHERDDDTLLLLQATPRRWLEDGKTIEVARAPTYHGPLAMTVTSRAGSGEIRARVVLSESRPPRTLLVRLRHPQGKPMKAVTVDGQDWTDFDAGREWVRIRQPKPGAHEIVSHY